MKLTIAIPTYNREKTLARTLDSVERQSLDDVNILVLDNASSDRTEEIVKYYIEKYGNVQYKRNEENIGADANFLNCYREATSEYIYILSSDDVLVEGAVETILKKIEELGGADLFFLNHYGFSGDNYLKSVGETMFLSTTEKDYVTTDKTRFIRDVKYQLTYVSSFIISKALFNRVKKPEQYVGTSFLHACIALEGTKNIDTRLAVLHNPLVAQDVTPGATSIINRYFEVFAKKQYHVLCEVAPQSGYDRNLMNHIFFRRAIETWPRAIIAMRMMNVKNWKQNYEDFGKPLVKKSRQLKIAMFPAIYCPVPILKAVKRVYKTIKK